jgi:hypothetical protein
MSNPRPRRVYPINGADDPLALAFKAVAAKARRRSSLVIWQAAYDRVFGSHPELVEWYAQYAYWHPEDDVA